MPTFAISLHPEALLTSRHVAADQFIGKSLPYAQEVCACLVDALRGYTNLPLQSADFGLFSSVHSPTYLNQIQELAAGNTPDPYPRLSAECSGMWYALPGYCAGLGGMLTAIDLMKAGTLDRAFCYSLGGHHAYADYGHGYGMLNPLAATVRYAQRQGFARVLIIDWDIHHGDGTQAIFAHDSSVYHISIHSAIDLYMAIQRVIRAGTTTAATAVGHCNIPVLTQRFDDSDWAKLGLTGSYYRAATCIPAFVDALQSLPWEPDLICIFAGVDSHRDDCGAGITDWENSDFQTLTRLVLNMAQRSNCPVLSIKGGGYNLPVTIAAIASHVEALAVG